jgi:uncharacterized phage-associated protein
MNQIKTIVQSVHYILFHIDLADKKKIIKMLFLADKLHLLTFGRLITGDEYVAMKHGPVGSVALDILDTDMEYLEPSEIEYIKTQLNQINPLEYQAKNSSNYEMLSETDKQSLDIIINKFGTMDSKSLEDITHLYPEWKQHEEQLKSGSIKAVPISVEELFTTAIQNDPLGISLEKIKLAKDIYNGYC